MAAFIAVEKSAARPMLDLSLFRYPRLYDLPHGVHFDGQRTHQRDVAGEQRAKLGFNIHWFLGTFPTTLARRAMICPAHRA